jgi:hypothetical protein
MMAMSRATEALSATRGVHAGAVDALSAILDAHVACD